MGIRSLWGKHWEPLGDNGEAINQKARSIPGEGVWSEMELAFQLLYSGDASPEKKVLVQEMTAQTSKDSWESPWVEREHKQKRQIMKSGLCRYEKKT